jgi:ABC-type Fe3+/spermidine/putrescine transport system ATPase subunit
LLTDTTKLLKNKKLLQIKNIGFSYQNKQVLKNISFEIPQGHTASILGENGSGKSTLLRLIGGYLSPDEGEILFEGIKVQGPEQKLIPGHDKIKMVFQDFKLAFRQTVRENIYGLLPPFIEEEKQYRTDKLLTKFNLLHLSEKKVEEISGGEKQKLSIARAMALEPKIILMDEPFSNLDTFIRDEVENIVFNALKDLRISVIQITHDPIDALRYSDEIIILKDSQILEKNSPEKIYYNPQYAYSASLTGHINILSDSDASFLGINRFVRPEQIKISSADKGIAAQVINTRFCGPYYASELILSGRIRIAAHFEKPLTPGMEIKVEIASTF